MTFTDPSLLWLGSAMTALVLVGVLSHAARRRRLAEFLGGRRAVARISRQDLSGLRIGRALLLGLAGLSLATAAAEPRWLAAPSPEPPVDRLILAVDVSASMQAVDESPTRLARAAVVAGELLEAVEGQEVGLLLFAGKTYPLAPPTRDHRALAFLLRGMTPTMASAYDPGTLLSVAIGDAAALLEHTAPTADGAPAAPPPSGRRRIVLIGDGEAGEPADAVREAAQAAAAAGIDVYTIGVGTERGAGMSLPAGTYQLGGPVVDRSGAPGTSRLREAVLRSVAAEAGGRYAHAEAQADLRALRADLTDVGVEAESNEAGAPAWARYDLTFLLGVAALLLVFAESLLDATLPRLPSLRARELT